MNDTYYHFHLYYPVEEIERAQKVIDKVKLELTSEVGRVWDKPVGPHPIGSCQVTIKKQEFLTAIHWFMKYREGFDLFIHPVTGNDLEDHTKNQMWMGKSYDLDTSIFS